MATPIEAAHANNSRIRITISENAMEVRANFLPYPSLGEPLSPAYVDSALRADNIVYGIQEDAILKALDECSKTQKPVYNALIAQGSEPVNEIPPYFELRPKFDPRAKNGIDANVNEKIDFREFSPFTIVRKNEYLAVFKQGNAGQKGVNVYGAELPFQITPAGCITPGNNIRVEGEDARSGLYSTAQGQLLLSDGVLHVEETLEIAGSVGYATGHIDFPGDIVIHGFVNDGFKLYSGGAITCKQTLDVTDVVCASNLTVNGGVIGRQQASIKVNAEAQVRFIDHCNFECGGNVNVGAEIVNSTVYTMGQVMMSPGSSIIASSVHAFHTVFVTNIENRSGETSSFHIGIDFTMIESVKKSQARFEDISQKLAAAEARIAAMPPNQKGYFEDVRRRIAERQIAEAENLNALLARLYVDEDAALQVAGEVARGTRIEIGRATYKVVASMQNICFKLNEQRNRIIFDKYEPDPASKLKFISVRRKPANNAK
jgi:uncharacterized protein (DUF342 family)